MPMRSQGTKIKICGLTKPEEAAFLNDGKVDYAGFVVFYPKSPRNVSLDRAKEIMAELDPGIVRTAVCVNPSIGQVNALAGAGFQLLQVHGQLFPEIFLNSSLPVWKAFNGENPGEVKLCERLPKVEAFLLDAKRPGSGAAFDWDEIAGLVRNTKKKIVLAGGLDPENVTEGLSFWKPWCVDVSSGVEWKDSPKGSGKDPERIRRFVEAVREWDEKEIPF